MEQDKKPSILILSSAESEETVPLNNHFVEELRARMGGEVDLEWHNYHDIRIEFSTGGLSIFLRGQNRALSSFDFVYIKSYFRYSELAGVIATYLDSTSTKFVCSELKGHIALTKLTQLARMSVNYISIADTIFMLHGEFKQSYAEIEQKIGVPFIFKSIDGSTGEENFLIKSEEEFQSALGQYPDLQFIAQKFIDNDSDLRVLVVGGEIKLVIKRQRKDNSTHLNNTSQGANAFLVPVQELTQEHQDLSLRAAQAMGREIAGVDLLFETNTGDPFILEVNASPQIASGAFTEEKLNIYSEYFKSMVK